MISYIVRKCNTFRKKNKKNPEDTIEDILAMADLYGCNAVVVKQFEDAPKQIGHFKQYFDSENYIVYAIQ